jgi:hypothetical protein
MNTKKALAVLLCSIPLSVAAQPQTCVATNDADKLQLMRKELDAAKVVSRVRKNFLCVAPKDRGALVAAQQKIFPPTAPQPSDAREKK